MRSAPEIHETVLTVVKLTCEANGFEFGGAIHDADGYSFRVLGVPEHMVDGFRSMIFNVLLYKLGVGVAFQPNVSIDLDGSVLVERKYRYKESFQKNLRAFTKDFLSDFIDLHVSKYVEENSTLEDLESPRNFSRLVIHPLQRSMMDRLVSDPEIAVDMLHNFKALGVMLSVSEFAEAEELLKMDSAEYLSDRSLMSKKVEAIGTVMRNYLGGFHNPIQILSYLYFLEKVLKEKGYKINDRSLILDISKLLKPELFGSIDDGMFFDLGGSFACERGLKNIATVKEMVGKQNCPGLSFTIFQNLRPIVYEMMEGLEEKFPEFGYGLFIDQNALSNADLKLDNNPYLEQMI